jgi:4-aminobutyrate aminotransferase-like enzyme
VGRRRYLHHQLRLIRTSRPSPRLRGRDVKIADAFDTGIKYFNTFGGNPVSCAIGSTVLDIVIEDGLQQRAKGIGHYFHQQLLAVQNSHEIIGDVRAQGLYLGVELVTDRVTKEPATAAAFAVTELRRSRESSCSRTASTTTC